MTKLMLAPNLKTSKKFQDNQLEGAICLDMLQDENVLKQAYDYQGKRYINVKVVKRQVINDRGATHYIEVKENFKKGGE